MTNSCCKKCTAIGKWFIKYKVQLVLLFTIMSATIPFGLLTPMLPTYIRSLGGGNIEYGFVLTAYSVAQFIGSLFIGILSDYIGRKYTLMLACFGIGLFNFLLGLANTIALTVIFRAGTGLFANLTTVAMALTSDISTSSSERTIWFGWYGSCVGIGIVLGPILGGFLADCALIVPCSVSGGLCLIALVLNTLFVKETLTKEKRRKCPWAKPKKESYDLLPAPSPIMDNAVVTPTSSSSTDNLSPNDKNPKSSDKSDIYKSGFSSSSSSFPSSSSASMDATNTNPTPCSSGTPSATKEMTVAPSPGLSSSSESSSSTSPLPSQAKAESALRSSPKPKSKSALLSILSNVGYLIALLNYFTSTFEYSAIQTVLPPLCLDRYNFTAKMVGFITMCYGFGMAFIQIFFIPIIIPRLGEKKPLIVGSVVASLALVLMSVIRSNIAVWFFSVLFGLGQAFVVPTSTSIFAYFGDQQTKGMVLGIGQCVQAASRAVAPMICSALYDVWDQLPFYVSVVIAIIGCLCLAPVKLKGKGKKTATDTQKVEEGKAEGKEDATENKGKEVKERNTEKTDIESVRLVEMNEMDLEAEHEQEQHGKAGTESEAGHLKESRSKQNVSSGVPSDSSASLSSSNDEMHIYAQATPLRSIGSLSRLLKVPSEHPSSTGASDQSASTSASASASSSAKPQSLPPTLMGNAPHSDGAVGIMHPSASFPNRAPLMKHSENASSLSSQQHSHALLPQHASKDGQAASSAQKEEGSHFLSVHSFEDFYSNLHYFSESYGLNESKDAIKEEQVKEWAKERERRQREGQKRNSLKTERTGSGLQKVKFGAIEEKDNEGFFEDEDDDDDDDNLDVENPHVVSDEKLIDDEFVRLNPEWNKQTDDDKRQDDKKSDSSEKAKEGASEQTHADRESAVVKIIGRPS
ncbi:putative major facilitator transporter [Monocercomonoides exilis]|uniref:putative major facilitator transporter n=1 Tax=Monocercomonoides exilis TaxID=2049356 RepID=UPI003559AB36|nr:putative major facilitator transporter [Monocercomonoides exilis]|eukprot:MONOS_1063.1-p1 / transcript=MONOS_1063.1 / gene=MONOS_1063 / organism=Monocercomonoides_exilis_PA203 / gene_product=major facilitator transporter / transcript_product=major facilitator transporter / location=Mono_scaffold00018:67140-70016(+) / protein_length=917 / sequence_SO=supercontig / SO=protein_coding / is_pseudo=false